MWIWLIVGIIIIFAIICYKSKIRDFACICSSSPFIKIYPISYQEIQHTLKHYPSKKITIAGSQYSHGGQTLLDDSIHIDMNGLNRIIDFDYKTIIVESGITWYEILKFLDKYNLSVVEMQSYSNFTVGGSISVNCHGRGMSTVADTVLSLKVMLANREIVDVTPKDELFRGIVGGYGGLGIILQAQLMITKNTVLENKIFITDKIIDQPNVVFFNANIYPTREKEIVNIVYTESKKSLTVRDRLQKHKTFHWITMLGEQLLRRTNITKELRSLYEPKLMQNQVIWRNYEMSYDVQSLNPLIKFPTTSILQEYFLPKENIYIFLDYFWSIVKIYDINILNVSLRFVKSTSIPILNYCEENRVAVVIYFNMWHHEYDHTEKWSRLLIDKVLDLDGCYYLPYLPFASIEQFRRAYPSWKKYLSLKETYDPYHRFSNMFLTKYL